VKLITGSCPETKLSPLNSSYPELTLWCYKTGARGVKDPTGTCFVHNPLNC
jgi:hypothetical protein